MRRLLLTLALTFLCSMCIAADSSKTKLDVLLLPVQRSILSSEVQSHVKKIHFNIGDKFKNGDLLLSMADDIYEANVKKVAAKLLIAKANFSKLNFNIAKAEAIKAEAKLKSARVELAAKEKLFKQDSISGSEIEKARAMLKIATADLSIVKEQTLELKSEIAVAEATVKIAQADLEVAQRHLSSCAMRAPFSGKVVNVAVNPMETVQSGQNVIEILDDSVLLAQFFVPPSRMQSFSVGSKVSISVRETNSKIEVTVSRISPQIDPVTHTITVFAEVKNDGSLTSGMRGQIILK